MPDLTVNPDPIRIVSGPAAQARALWEQVGGAPAGHHRCAYEDGRGRGRSTETKGRVVRTAGKVEVGYLCSRHDSRED